MPSNYQITEPHPSAGKYIHSGRGGAGNTFKAPKTSSPSSAKGPASLFGGSIPLTSSKFSSGRGGAGNIHPNSERATFSFDEELARQTTREKKMNVDGAVYHVGRGGAGNWTAAKPASSRKDSSSSADSTSSGRSGFLSRLSNTFERR